MQNLSFTEYFGSVPERVFSSPGRTELSGNHTDHQHGCVLAATIDLETKAWVAHNDLLQLRVQSEGYPLCVIDLSDLEKKEGEKNTTASLVRGIAFRFKQLGANLSGLDLYVVSSVLPGSGLSSSASFEVLIAEVLSDYFLPEMSKTEIAQIGQWAENNYFGKPCGLMDQMACATGNIISIDFENPTAPKVDRLDFDFSASGHVICIIDTHASHAELTGEYAAIPQEIHKICRYFHKEVLRDIPEDDFYREIPHLRELAGDRAVLRCIHFYEENRRVEKQVQALKIRDFDRFLQLTDESGYSSWMYLQNVIPSGSICHQEMATALSLTRKALNGRGACRVHGGGFAGTLLAYVPVSRLASFQDRINFWLGDESCHVLAINQYGCRRIITDD